MNTILNDTYSHTDNTIISIDLIKNTFGLSGDFDTVEYDGSKNAIILKRDYRGEVADG